MEPAKKKEKEYLLGGNVPVVEEEQEAEEPKTFLDKLMAKRPRLVEPAFFLYMLSIWSYLPLNEQYVYKLLTEEQQEIYNVTSSYDLPDDALAFIKVTVSNYTLIFNVCETMPAVLVSLVLCSWGDKHGRKLGLLVPCIGGVIKSILYVLFEIYKWKTPILIIPNLLEGMSGSHMTIAGAAYAYVSDVVDGSSLTFRFAVLNGLLFAGSSVGNVAIGYMIQDLGYLNSFYIMTSWYAMALFYVVFLLPETVDTKKTLKDVDEEKKSVCGTLREVMNSTVTAFRVYVKPRKDKNAQLRLVLMLGASTLHAILVLGQVELDTIFLIGPPFYFSPIEVGYFLAFLCATSVIGPIIGTKLFEMCGVPDAGMGIVASISGAAAFFLQAFASTKLAIFMVPVLNIYSASITALSRAIMSKDVDAEEQGALQASVSSMNTFGDLVSVTLLIGMFSATVNTFYGATFVLIGCLCVLCCICFICVATCLKPMKQDPQSYEAVDATSEKYLTKSLGTEPSSIPE